MRTFPHFNSSHGDVCPLCKKGQDAETVLIPIPGTEDGHNIQAQQWHKKCYDLLCAALVADAKIHRDTGLELRQKEIIQYADAERLIAWIDDPDRMRANVAFTEGNERQIAYRFEQLLAKTRN